MFENEKDMLLALKKRAESIRPPGELKRKVMRVLELSNEEGKTLGKVTVDTFDTNDPVDRIVRQLEPGTGRAIYVANTSPELAFTQQTNYKPVPWLFGTAELIKQAKPYTFRLVSGIEPVSISVMYGFDSLQPHEIEEMRKEAESTDRTIVIRSMRPNGKLVGALFRYVVDGKHLELHLLTTTKSAVHVPELDQHLVERAAVGRHPAVYIADSISHQLIWMTEDHGQPLHYELRSSELDRERLFDIAEEIAARHDA